MTETLPSFQAFLPPKAELLQRILKLDSGQYAMALGVIVPFSLHAEHTPPPALPASLWDAVSQALGQHGQIDEGWPKARGEWLAFGHCHPPAGYTEWPVSARLTVGPLDKQLAIQQDQTTVSGFAPLPPDGPQRAARQGRHDADWLKTRWPHTATDTDPLFFQQAPQDQWLDGYWSGNEAVLVRNMHPRHPDLQGRIPALRPRFFIHQTQASGSPDFAELQVHADTVWLLPEVQLGLVIYRALAPVQSSDGRDINALLAAFEPLDSQALAIDHYVQRCLQAMAPAFAQQVATPPPPDYSGLSYPQLLEKITEQKAQFQQMLQSNGLDDEAMIQELLANPHTRVFAQAVARRSGTLSGFFTEIQSVLQEFEDIDDAALQDLLQHRSAAGPTLASVLPAPMVTAAQAPQAPPPADGHALQDQALAARHRQLVQARSAQGQSCAGLDLSQANLAGMDLAGMDFSDALLAGANFAGAQLPGATFDRALLQGARLDAANLAGCRFHQATLDHASFSGATLQGAVLDDSNCHGANFAGADLSGISLRGTSLTQAWLQQAHAPRLQAEQANFSQANLEGGNLSSAQLRQANFTGARLSRIVLDDACCSQANFTLADLSRASLQRCDLSDSQCTVGSQWQGADLRQANLGGASWMGAALEDARLEDIQAQGADLSDTRLNNSRLTGSDLRQTSFDRADLSHACLSRSNLMDASFNHSQLSHCRIEHSNLYAASFIDAIMDNTALTGSTLDATILPVRKAAL